MSLGAGMEAIYLDKAQVAQLANTPICNKCYQFNGLGETCSNP